MSASPSAARAPAGVPAARVPRRRALVRAIAANRLATACAVVLLALVLACVLAGLIAPDPPQSQDLTSVLQGPSAHHLLGTDTLGRDVLSRLLYGGRRSLLSVAEGLGVVLVLGVPLGLLAGYAGGWVDRTIAAVNETVMAIPAIIFILVVLALLPHDEDAAMIAFGLLGVPTVARVVRSAAVTVREELYVAAARTGGVSQPRIVVRHVLPRTLGPVIVQASLFCAYALTFETGLAYLGVTGGTSTPTWGGMVAEASTVVERQSWLLFPSGLTIALTILALGLLGDGVRDAAARERAPVRRRRRGGRARSVSRPRASDTNGASPSANGGDPATESGALLEVRELVIEAADADRVTTLVDGVSFRVAPGETVGLVGESGCGKTVTALSILRLLGAGLEVVHGRVALDGDDLLALDGRGFDRLRGSTLAYISQEPQASLDPTFSVGSQLGEVVRHHDRCSRAQARRRVLELLALVDLPEPERVVGRYPHELSGGMAQRVAIALALAGRPRLLIADEPTTALDVTVQAQILGLLRRLQRETGMAVVIITHNWGVVADLCDRTVVMYAGQVVEDADAQEIFDEPLHPYTLGLLASHPSLAHAGEPMTAMAGRVPPPGAWPQGCRFADRCRFEAPECHAGAIPLSHPAAGRASRCVRIERVAETVERA